MQKGLSLGVRTSEENFGCIGNVRIIPLYMIGRYDALLRTNGEDGNSTDSNM